MFDPDSMSPKLLNVERLERKFASLTRSRESIQGLSMWIIRHKENHHEIVDKWFDALKRDFNVLNMFYVANDVIQNCARKKAPEYREAFAAVLEKAVSLEKVKEIKSEVIRMINLWQNREIYGDAFFKRLENILNSTSAEESKEEVIELNEAEIIANFKLDNLINSLKRLKTMKRELHEKQSFLEDIEEPVITNFDNVIVKLESKQEIRKFDKHRKLIEDYLCLADKVLAAEKSFLLDVKNTTVFYSAQFEDAKKVAHAYRIYAKKIKIVEKSLLEKRLNFPIQSPDSPIECLPSPVLESDISQTSLPNGSPSKSVNSMDTKSTNLDHSPTVNNESFDSTIIEKSKHSPEKTMDFVTTECSASERYELIEASNKNGDYINLKKSSSVSSLSEVAEGSISPIEVTAALHESPVTEVSLKSPAEDIDIVSSSSKSSDIIVSSSSFKSPDVIVSSSLSKSSDVIPSSLSKSSDVIVPPSSSQSSDVIVPPSSSQSSDVIVPPSSSQSSDVIVPPSSSQSSDTIVPPSSSKSSDIVPSSSSKSSDVVSLTSQKSPVSVPSKSSSSAVLDSLKSVIPDILKTITAASETSSSVKTIILPNSETTDDIDFLLDKAYNAQVKSKTNYKRKIDTLLKLKQAKSCKLDNEKCAQESDKISETVKLPFSSEIKWLCPNEDLLNVSNPSSTSTTAMVVTSEETKITVSDCVHESTSVESDSLKKGQAQVTLKGEITPLDSTTAQHSSPSQATEELPKVSEVKSITPPISLGFQTLSKIPTELLKSILKSNMGNIDFNMHSFSNTAKSKAPKELSQTEWTSSNSCEKDACYENLQQDPLPVDAEESVCEDMDEKIDEFVDSKEVDGEFVDSKEVDGEFVDSKEVVDEFVDSKEIVDVKSDDITLQSNSFLDSLQRVLHCFSKKGKSCDLQQKSTFQHSLPPENTLKLYSFLMKCSGKEDLTNEQSLPNLSTLPTVQANSVTSDHGTEVNRNVHEVSTNKDFLYQADNLEVMDMEVDSDESCD